MDFREVVERRRMVRTYASRPVDAAMVDRIIAAGLRAPSAGFTQGWAFLVFEGAEQTARFWALTARGSEPPPAGGRIDRMRRAPVVIVPMSHKQAYLTRYAQDDKAAQGLRDEAAWPVPYWDIDTGFATMAMLLAATDAGLGAGLLGIFRDEQALLAEMGVPEGYRPIVAMTLGWPAEHDPPSPSIARGRRAGAETVHYGRWNGERSTVPGAWAGRVGRGPLESPPLESPPLESPPLESPPLS